MVFRTSWDSVYRVARMVRSHRGLILSWFRARGELSNAIVEGFNGKARVTTKKAFGHRTCEALEIALYHALGDLSGPDIQIRHATARGPEAGAAVAAHEAASQPSPARQAIAASCRVRLPAARILPPAAGSRVRGSPRHPVMTPPAFSTTGTSAQ